MADNFPILSASSSWPFFWAIENRLLSVLKRKCGLTCALRSRTSVWKCWASAWLRIRSYRIHSLMKKFAAAIASTDKKIRAMTSCVCSQLSTGDLTKGGGIPGETLFDGVRRNAVSDRKPCEARFGEASSEAVSDRDSKKTLVCGGPSRAVSSRTRSESAF